MSKAKSRACLIRFAPCRLACTSARSQITFLDNFHETTNDFPRSTLEFQSSTRYRDQFALRRNARPDFDAKQACIACFFGQGVDSTYPGSRIC